MYQPAHDYGSVHIADEVIGIIAGLAATEIEGVKSMTGGFGGGLAELLGKKNLSKGVKLDVGEKEAKIDLYLVIEYGAVVHAVATKVQENVKKAIEGMTGLKVVEVNAYITSIDTHLIKEEEREKEAREKEAKEKAKKEAKAKKKEKDKAKSKGQEKEKEKEQAQEQAKEQAKEQEQEQEQAHDLEKDEVEQEKKEVNEGVQEKEEKEEE